ncbi:MAG: CvpA family protein [Lactobacillus sp.]|jgi:membrane protein required for colicin V production|nr:CvpA family protein [Lactobacillus sp.]
MININNLDVIILIIIGISALIALSRGFVKEVLSIVGWILAFACIIYLLPVLNPITMKYIASGLVSGIITALFVFVGFLVFWILLTGNIVGQIKDSRFNWLDKFLGLFFGLARAFLIVILFNILISWVIPAEEQSEFFSESKYFKMAGNFAKPIEALIPAETLESIKSKAKDASEKEEKKEVDKKKKNETDELFEKLARPKVKKKVEEVKTKAIEKAKKQPEAKTVESSKKAAAKPAAKPDQEGYNKSDRNELDNLIEEAL